MRGQIFLLILVILDHKSGADGVGFEPLEDFFDHRNDVEPQHFVPVDVKSDLVEINIPSGKVNVCLAIAVILKKEYSIGI